MLTRNDIQIDLLSKLNELCEKSNVKYVLHGHAAFLAFNNQALDKINTLEVLMCQGDAEKIADALDDENYYFEDSRNNPKFDQQYMMFGFKNSLDIKNIDLNFNKTRHIKNHCIRITIHFIEKPRKRITGKILKFNHKLLKVNYIQTENNQNSVLIKKKLANNFFKIIRPSFYNKMIHQFKINNISINTWSDIKKYPLVQMANKMPINSDIFNSILKVNIDDTYSFIFKDFEKYATHFYGENWQDKKWPQVTSHTSPLISWKEYSNDSDVNKHYNEIRKRYEFTYKEAEKTAADRKIIREMRRHILQSERVVHNRQYYIENKDYIISLYQNGNLDELKDMLNPLVNSMKSGIKTGYTYSVDEEIDNILDSYLRQENMSELADNIITYRIDI